MVQYYTAFTKRSGCNIAYIFTFAVKNLISSMLLTKGFYKIVMFEPFIN